MRGRRLIRLPQGPPDAGGAHLEKGGCQSQADGLTVGPQQGHLAQSILKGRWVEARVAAAAGRVMQQRSRSPPGEPRRPQLDRPRRDAKTLRDLLDGCPVEREKHNAAAEDEALRRGAGTYPAPQHVGRIKSHLPCAGHVTGQAFGDSRQSYSRREIGASLLGRHPTWQIAFSGGPQEFEAGYFTPCLKLEPGERRPQPAPENRDRLSCMIAD